MHEWAAPRRGQSLHTHVLYHQHRRHSYNTGLWSELRLQHVVGVGIVLQREEATAGVSAAEALTAPARTDDRAHAARDGRQALQIVSSSLSGDRKDTEV